MTLDVLLSATAIIALSVVFGAVPIYGLVCCSDWFGCWSRRSVDEGIARPFSPELADSVKQDTGILHFPDRHSQVRIDRDVIADARVDQLAS